MINNSEFILKEIPKINPVLEEYRYREFWSEQKRNVIEGTWVGGKWCPPTLYYHANFSIIPMESQSGSQIYARPFVRDIDWEFYSYYEEARGFSGFEGDDEFSCHRALIEDMDDKEIISLFCTDIFTGEIHPKFYNNIFKPDGTRKTYIPARDYIPKIHKGNLGKPIYNNNAKNLSVFGTRGGGKSIWASTTVLTNWQFGGATDYDEYLAALKAKNYQISTTIIGAYEGKYTTTLRDYILTNKKFLKENNKVVYGGLEYYCPLWVDHTGSTMINHNEGLSTKHGSRLLSRAFSDSSTSANSTRPNLAVIDEVGFAKNIEDVISSIQGSEASKKRNNLTMLFLGTGGFSKGSSILHFEKIFRNPKDYNCLEFPDIWENRGSVGYFLPVTKTNLNYKDASNNYITDLEYANKKEAQIRAAIKDPKALARRKVNAPLTPSESFLVVDGTKFPAGLLTEQLQNILGGKYVDRVNASWKGWLKFNSQGEVYMEVSEVDKPIRSYPLLQEDEHLKKGAVEIWAKPATDDNGIVPHGRYIGGIDVVHKDIAQTDSLPSLFIFDTLTDRIVLEYTGRTDRKSFFFEQARKAAIYYNAVIMYEQSMTDLFTHFKKENALRYLADTPKDLRNSDTWREGADTSKGISANEKIKFTGESFILDWLLTPIRQDSEELNLNTIYSKALLEELIVHDGERNTDRVSALIQLFWYKNSLKRAYKEEHARKKTALEDYYSRRKLLSKRKDGGYVHPADRYRK
ncbi:MAG TPA: hypothetical protein VIK77_00285 [Tissierellaceae bacterium]